MADGRFQSTDEVIAEALRLLQARNTMATTRYWYVNCPVCRQGRVFVEVNLETNELMLECEECSRAWTSPEKVSPTENAFLAIDIESRFANAEEIELRGWSKWSFRQIAG